jgi:tRNA(Ile)-lysidine synthase
MHELAARLLRTIRKQELLRAGDRVAVAVSGGADSVALLCLLTELKSELGIVLSVAHVNHKLRGAESDEDERFVTELAAASGLELHAVTRRLEPGAAEAPAQGSSGDAESTVGVKSGVEAAARELRYEFFRELAHQGRVGKIATAHTLDDQAETVLLRIFRGTGIRGLAGIHPRLRLVDNGARKNAENCKEEVCTKDERHGTGEVVRPLLGFRRAELRDYLRARGQSWREDSSNENMAFLRNRVRQRLLPLIVEEYGAATIEHMAELAEIARAEEEWAVSTQCSVRSARSAVSAAGATLEVEQLLTLPLAVGRRLVRAWVETNAPEVKISFRLIEEILALARGEAGKKLELTGGATCQTIVRRGRKELVLEWKDGNAPGSYQYRLAFPGEIAVPELGIHIEARLMDVARVPEGERHGLLDPALLGAELVVRNWRPGDRYWPAHTAAEKKVKELLSDRHATGTEKKLWPVVAAEDGGLVWMRGFAAPDVVRARTGEAIWIREIGSRS